VNVVDKVCVPVSTVPAAGLYAKVPATLAVAFNCVALKTVPATTDAGVAQVIVGVVFAPAPVVQGDVVWPAISRPFERTM
jgi:hypothetical protein